MTSIKQAAPNSWSKEGIVLFLENKITEKTNARHTGKNAIIALRRVRFMAIRRISESQNSKSIENCNCRGMPALFGVSNDVSGESSGP